jgi:hypothetical protein
LEALCGDVWGRKKGNERWCRRPESNRHGVATGRF